MRRRGFTLIEILIVLAIIGLLAAILLPVLASVREAGRRTSCAANLRQLGQAMQMYTQDYDRYPHAVDPADKYAPQIWQDQAIADGFDLQALPMLTDVMMPYVKSPRLWRCPSDTGFEAPDNIPWQLEGEPTLPSCFQKYGTSYFYRTELMFRNLAEEQLPHPAETNVLCDAHGSWHGAKMLNLSNAKRYNVLFADGHVKNVDESGMDAAWFTALK